MALLRALMKPHPAVADRGRRRKGSSDAACVIVANFTSLIKSAVGIFYVYILFF